MSDPKSSKVPVGLWLLLIKLGPKILSVLGKILSVVFKTKAGLAAVSYGSYAWMFSWQFAVVLMVSLGIHEAGHVWAMRRVGIKTRGFYFLPFVGGAAVMDSSFKSQRDHIFVALMGPVWGTAVALVALAVYSITASPLWAGLTAWIAALNLLNLLPVHPLDGGRVLYAVMLSIPGRTGWYALLAVSTAFMVLCGFLGIWLFVVIGIVGFLEITFTARRERNKREVLQSIELMLERMKELRVNADGAETKSISTAMQSKLAGITGLELLLLDFSKFHEAHILEFEEKMRNFADEIRAELIAPLTLPQLLVGVAWYFALVACLLGLVMGMFSIEGAGEALKLFQS